LQQSYVSSTALRVHAYTGPKYPTLIAKTKISKEKTETHLVENTEYRPKEKRLGNQSNICRQTQQFHQHKNYKRIQENTTAYLQQQQSCVSIHQDEISEELQENTTGYLQQRRIHIRPHSTTLLLRPKIFNPLLSIVHLRLLLAARNQVLQ
jgi:hypothetical protein